MSLSPCKNLNHLHLISPKYDKDTHAELAVSCSNSGMDKIPQHKSPKTAYLKCFYMSGYNAPSCVKADTSHA